MEPGEPPMGIERLATLIKRNGRAPVPMTGTGASSLNLEGRDSLRLVPALSLPLPLLGRWANQVDPFLDMVLHVEVSDTIRPPLWRFTTL